MPKEIIGIDIGYRNFAICKLRFEGLRYNRDSTEEMPIFTVSHMEVWDLQNSRAIMNSQVDGGPLETYRIPHSLVNPTNINQWLCSLNHFLNRSPWIYKKYSEDGGDESPLVLPRVTIENQCGHILRNKNKKKYTHNGEKDKYDGWDMFRLVNCVETSIHMRDLCDADPTFNKLLTRVIGKSALKYGIKSNGSLEYPERKEESVEITRALFKALGMDNWNVYMDSLLSMKPPQKVDDICDALLLALQVAVVEYEIELRNKQKNGMNMPIVYTDMDYTKFDNSVYPKLLSSVLLDGSNEGKGVIEYEFLDESEEDDFKKKKPVKKRAYSKKKERDDDDDDDEEEEPKPKKRKYTRKVVSIDDDAITPIKKRKASPKEKKAPTKKSKKDT